MANPVTSVVYVVRHRTTSNHLRGVLEALDAVGAAPMCEVRIIAVSEGSAAVLPDGRWTVAGRVFVGGAVLNYDNLPPQGMLFVPEEAS